jgi:hypothetical protein
VHLNTAERTGALYDLIAPPIIEALKVECRDDAALQLNLRIIEFLLDEMQRRNENFKDCTNIASHAVRLNKFAAAQLLLNRGFKFNGNEIEDLFNWSNNLSEDEILCQADFLVLHRVNPLTAMSVAPEEMQIRLMQIAAKRGAPVKPLIEASGIVKKLVAKAEAGDKLGFIAALGHFDRLLSLNLLREQDPRAFKSDILEQCFRAAYAKAWTPGHVDVLDVAFRLGDFEITTMFCSPITVAVRSNRPELVEFLLNAGCSPWESTCAQEFFKDDGGLQEDGDTPLKIAKKRGYSRIVSILQNSLKKHPFGWLRRCFI